MKITKLLIINLLLIISIACGGSSGSGSGKNIPEPPINNPPVDININEIARNLRANLKTASSLEEVKQDYKKRIKASFIKALKNQVRYQNGICDSLRIYDYPIADTADINPEAGSEGSFSNTNLQEAEVDEADIIKTDGEYIFTLYDGKINIFQAWPADSYQLINSVVYNDQDHIEDNQVNMYLGDDFLALLNQSYNYQTRKYSTKLYYYDRAGSDLSLNYQKDFPGFLLESRLIDNQLVLIGNYKLGFNLHARIYDPIVLSVETLIPLFDTTEEIKEYYCGYPIDQPEGWVEWSTRWNNELDRLVENELSQSIVKSTLSFDSLDQYLDALIEAELLTQFNENFFCDNFYLESNINQDDSFYSNQLMMISNLNLKNPDQLTTSCIDSQYYKLSYVSEDSIFLVSNYPYQADYDSRECYSFSLDAIHHFDISNGRQSLYNGTRVIPGNILNSFSMSQYGHYLRVATSKGELIRDAVSETSNEIYTIDLDQKDLPIVGKINDIAPGEKIYSARFLGDKAYLVTFKKVDPFYVIDLADHENPKIAGELKIPGYSNYLHILDDHHVIGLGKDTEEALDGNFAWFQGVKLSLFDVTNPENPLEEDKEIIGDRGTSSHALFDHHAFSFLPESNLLALPVEYYAGARNLNGYGDFEYNGVHLYHIDPDSGITLSQAIKLNDDEYCRSAISRVLIFEDDQDQVTLYALQDNKLIQIKINQGVEPAIHPLSMTDEECDIYDDYVW